MSEVAIMAENVSKLYRLGEIGTGTLSHDLNRWWASIRGKEDPYMKLGQSNKRDEKGSDWVWALQDINFELNEGEVLGIIGRNGAGKSTLLKLLSRISNPTTGVIKARGRIASLLEVGTGFHPELTGRENIFLNGAILGMTKAEIKRKFDEIVDFAGVTRYIDTPVKRYSSGMYVRLAFGVAAHLEPEILIVDEVLAVGDAEFQKKALGKMKSVSQNDGRTVLFVSHNMASISTLCTKGLMMQNGQVAYQGDIEETIRQYNQSSGSGSNQVDGFYDLEKFNDPALNIKITSAQIYCDKVRTGTLLTGSNVVFEFSYTLKNEATLREFGIMVKNGAEEFVFEVDTNHLGEKIDDRVTEGTIRFEFPEFRLFGNEDFIIDYYFGDAQLRRSFLFKDLIRFSLLSTDVYNSGKILQSKYNKFYQDVIFSQ
ncbi:ABC transporter ATP-binding protein [Flavihumibacter fluvii]|uniref:ABC transporter ATP-binding protein n=1 Tax=Flavihumibacter fluvii TaxID=2838157 RepID=UPI001BDF283F|nr:ABC transporter ATP-binding protein [Flavihumibacter fluvii]ULQ52392.1 ABC transporter ATP-binding protein [Flavihumibacter fluvii]